MFLRFLFSLTFLFAFTADAMAEGAEASGAGAGIANFGLLIILFTIFYFLIIRPQSKRMRDHRDMCAALKEGDKVITNGGIHGTVTSVTDDTITLSIAEGVNVTFSKEAAAINLTASETKAQ